MDTTATPLPETLLSQGLLRKIEPLVQTIESQLKDLEQGQAHLLNNVATLSHDLALTETQLYQVSEIFAQLPHYIAKVNAIKSTMIQLHTQNKKLKRRTELVCSGRERQAARELETRAREQAYDRVIAAVEAPSASANRSPSPSVHSSSGDGGSTSATTTAAAAAGLPFPLPAKPAFPIVSKRSPNSSGTASPVPAPMREGSPAISPSPRSSASSSPRLITVSVPGIETPVVLPPSLSRTTPLHSSTSTGPGRPRRPDSVASTTSIQAGGGPPSSIGPTASATFIPASSRHRTTPSVSSSYSSSSLFSVSQVGVDRFPDLSVGAEREGGSSGHGGAVEVVRKKKKQPKKKQSVSSVVSLDTRQKAQGD